MKSKLFLLSFLMLLTVATNYAQGIAVQGIARDINNTARIKATLSLSFRIYYLPDATIYEVSKTVTSDAFGVFSVVLEPGAANNVTIANNQAFLKISEGTTIISDEMLRQVPYAIAASYATTAKNEVPTGSIMPFIGADAPAGWVLCNGKALPTTATALIGMVGSNAPDLRGMFLRGAGDDGRPETETVDLQTIQGDEFKKHDHEVNDPAHNHAYGDIFHSEGGSGIKLDAAGTGSGNTDSGNMGYEIPRTSDRSFTGITINSNGGLETRPVNYGVNYIIKL
jgi:hypothetical protein